MNAQRVATGVVLAALGALLLSVGIPALLAPAPVPTIQITDPVTRTDGAGDGGAVLPAEDPTAEPPPAGVPPARTDDDDTDDGDDDDSDGGDDSPDDAGGDSPGDDGDDGVDSPDDDDWDGDD